MGKRFKSEIRNKEVRTKLYLKDKKEKLKAKKKSKLENKDKPKQTPKTIENQRVKDETYIANDIENDAELQLDLSTDELSRHLNRAQRPVDMDENEFNAANGEKDASANGEEVEVDEEDEKNLSNDPKILITTTEITISFKTYKLCRELARVLPNAHYFYRKNVRLSKVIPEAIKRLYSAIIVINENRKEPSKQTRFLTSNSRYFIIQIQDEKLEYINFYVYNRQIIILIRDIKV